MRESAQLVSRSATGRRFPLEDLQLVMVLGRSAVAPGERDAFFSADLDDPAFAFEADVPDAQARHRVAIADRKLLEHSSFHFRPPRPAPSPRPSPGGRGSRSGLNPKSKIQNPKSDHPFTQTISLRPATTSTRSEDFSMPSTMG